MSDDSRSADLARVLAEHGALRLRSLSWWRVSLPLRKPLHHATALASTLDSVVVVADFDGIIGHAEVRANGAYATGESVDDIEAGFTHASILGAVLDDVTRTVITRSKLAAMAIDVAGWDALGQREDLPLYALLGGPKTNELTTHAQIGFGDVDSAVAWTRQFHAEGFTRLKVRVGSTDEESDLRRLRAVRRVAGSMTSIMADANGAWSLEQTLRVLPELEQLGIEWLEQPVAAEADLVAVTAQNRVPVRADESARDADAVAHLAATGAVNGVHLKLEKTGTVSRLLDAIKTARDAGLSVAFGQMDQGRLGCAATTQIAAGLGIDKAELWGCADVITDIAGPLTIERGAVRVPQLPGLGVRVTLSGQPRGTL